MVYFVYMSALFGESPTTAFYVVNYKDDSRRNKMITRLKSIGLDAHFVDPVSTQDPRIRDQPISDFQKRNWSIFFQHVDCMRNFYENTSYDYCIIAEDDVMISRRLTEQLPHIIHLYNKAELDMLLLSYLWPFELQENGYFPMLERETLDNNEYRIHGYPDDLWGAHMYFISRAHAKTLIDRYTPEYAIQQTPDKPFCTDWQFTKFGRRGLIVPMVGVEEGEVKTDHQGQIDFHRMCFEYNYHPNKFL